MGAAGQMEELNLTSIVRVRDSPSTCLHCLFVCFSFTPSRSLRCPLRSTEVLVSRRSRSWFRRRQTKTDRPPQLEELDLASRLPKTSRLQLREADGDDAGGDAEDDAEDDVGDDGGRSGDARCRQASSDVDR